MEQERNYIVDGFVFHSRRDAQRAQKEYDGVRYLQAKTDNEIDPEKLLQVYNRLIDQKMFETPIGTCYMKHLQDQIREAPYIMEEAIFPLEGSTNKNVVPPEKPSAPAPKRNKKHEKKQLDDAAKGAGRGRAAFTLSAVLNVILVIIVVGMFMLAKTINSPTILNYENEIINKYESWQQELEQREEAVKKAEDKLGINQD